MYFRPNSLQDALNVLADTRATILAGGTDVFPSLGDRPLSVVRALRGQKPFMQKNVPKYTPDWVATTSVWSAASGSGVA